MNSILEEAIEAWDDARKGVIAEVDNVPTKDFGFRPGKESRSLSELVVHIVEVGMMMSGELTRSDGSFRRKPYPELIEEYASSVQKLSSKPDLLKALQKTFKDGVKAIRDAGEIHILQTITRFDGKQGTRLAWLYHGIGHEEYHRGQLALYGRQLGLTPALTKLIRGE